MPDLAPRFVRRVILPAAYLVLSGGFAISGVIFYRARPFDVKAAILSDLESPDDNPHGYGAAAAGTAASAALLAPAAIVFFQQLRRGHPKLAMAGVGMFAVGLGAAMAIGILAPYTRGYTPVHVQLAYAAFIGICAGTWLDLLAARAAPAAIAIQGAVLVFLVYLYVGPDFINNDRLVTSLAFLEWLLCVDCGLALWALAKAVQGTDRAGAGRDRR